MLQDAARTPQTSPVRCWDAPDVPQDASNGPKAPQTCPRTPQVLSSPGFLGVPGVLWTAPGRPRRRLDAARAPYRASGRPRRAPGRF